MDYQTELDLDTLMKLRSIFESKVVNKKEDKNNITQITNIYENDKKINDDDLFIRGLAIQFLQNSNLDVNPDNCMIEYWRYRCFGDVLNSKLIRHTDSYGVFNCPINTCIFYIRKDKTLQGGNLDLYGYGINSYNFMNKPIKTIESNNNKVICMDGDIVHSISSFQGFGIRDAIVVQFEKSFTYKTLFLGFQIKKYVKTIM